MTSLYGTSEYSVGWITGTSRAATAALAMFDESRFMTEVPTGDKNTYFIGTIDPSALSPPFKACQGYYLGWPLQTPSTCIGPGSLTRAYLRSCRAIMTNQALSSKVAGIIDDAVKKGPKLGTEDQGGDSWVRPDASADRLFRADYNHVDDKALYEYCSNCDPSCEITRDNRQGYGPAIHCGIIASFNFQSDDTSVRNTLKDIRCLLL
ncbi:uncharacterized protein BDV17DRAFT_289936 [Aspergillus undulatus]|uniref:uncharacterized protein n=1 Tax=Aspergillus undulatus TaxID=1810928 RepID=UPI003CCD85E8